MWFPEIKLENWFNIYPDLKNQYPIKCLCGMNIFEVKPYVGKSWVGIISNNNCQCGLPACFVSIPRSHIMQNKIKDYLDDFLLA